MSRRSPKLFVALGALSFVAAACARGVEGDAPAQNEPPDARSPDPSPVVEGDGGAGDAAADAPANDAAESSTPCTSTMAVLAGDGAGAFASTWSNGTWSAPQVLAGSIVSPPALVASGSSYVGVVRAANDALAYTRAATGGSAWSAFAQVSGATTQGAPVLVDVMGTTHLVYWGINSKFYHGVYSGAAWDAASDPVGGAAAQSFGPSAPTGTARASGFAIVQAGSDSKLYAQAWNATWSAAFPSPAGGFPKTTASPRIVALTGGSGDSLVVWPHSDGLLMWALLGATGWKGAEIAVHNTTTTSARSDATVALAPLPNGGAMLVYVDGGGAPSFSTYTPTATPPWSAPAPFPAFATLASAPHVAAGVCGVDAVAVYATTGGGVDVLPYVGGAWSKTAVTVGSASATFAAIATHP